MKAIKIFITLTAVLCLAACQKDKALWGGEEETVPSVLQITPSTSEVVLYPDMQPSEIVLTATWNEADPRGEYDEISYIFKMDLADNMFETAVRYEDVTTFSISFTYQELYDLLTEKWHVKVGESAALDLRVIGDVYGPKFLMPEISTVRINVKIYSPEPRPLYIMGSAVPGGSNTDFTTRLKMQEVLIGKEYTYTGTFLAGDVKFITDATDPVTILPSYNKGADSRTLVERKEAGDPDNMFSLSAGTYAITVRLDHLTVTFHKEVTIEGAVWASSNVDEKGTFAGAPDERGKFFRFHENVGYSATGAPDPAWPESIDSQDTYWKSDPCPAGWHLPDYAQLTNLKNAGSSWAAAGERGNAVAGRFFGPGSNKVRIDSIANCIFIPASGQRKSTNGELQYSGEKGFVASRNPYWGETSMVLVFDATTINLVMARKDEPGGSDILLGTGFSVRCIKN